MIEKGILHYVQNDKNGGILHYVQNDSVAHARNDN